MNTSQTRIEALTHHSHPTELNTLRVAATHKPQKKVSKTIMTENNAVNALEDLVCYITGRHTVSHISHIPYTPSGDSFDEYELNREELDRLENEQEYLSELRMKLDTTDKYEDLDDITWAICEVKGLLN
jgi:hypothetical protein